MKKYLTFEFLGAVVLGIGMTLWSIALVYFGFTDEEVKEFYPALSTAMIVVGFLGTMIFPAAWFDAIREYVEEHE